MVVNLPGIGTNKHLTAILDVLDSIKLLPHRPAETNIMYGYVAQDRLTAVIAQLVHVLKQRGYEVHECVWSSEVVLLALNDTSQPLALRLTSSRAERFNLYAFSRPQDAQSLWQWAQAMKREDLRKWRDAGP